MITKLCNKCQTQNLGNAIIINKDGKCKECGRQLLNNPITKVLPKDTTRPRILIGVTIRIKTSLGNLYITINEHEGRPFEVFAIIGKSGKSIQAKAEAIGRLVSLNLRSGVGVDKIINQLKDIAGETTTFDNGKPIKSIPDGIAKILEELYGTTSTDLEEGKSEEDARGDGLKTK